MNHAIYIVDAFAEQRFSGNPAAVCLLNGDADYRWMQAVATEMNLSETAFLRQTSDNEWALRWFTPTIEVDLCGHATLASAHVLCVRSVYRKTYYALTPAAVGCRPSDPVSGFTSTCQSIGLFPRRFQKGLSRPWAQASRRFARAARICLWCWNGTPSCGVLTLTCSVWLSSTRGR
ncbi:MAG: PhzF family phenazine biosynthesis isomerase [Candidatus Thiodiazotropha taylori]